MGHIPSLLQVAVQAKCIDFTGGGQSLSETPAFTLDRWHLHGSTVRQFVCLMMYPSILGVPPVETAGNRHENIPPVLCRTEAPASEWLEAAVAWQVTDSECLWGGGWSEKMEMWWEYHGNIMGISWEYHGNVLGLLWGDGINETWMALPLRWLAEISEPNEDCWENIY